MKNFRAILSILRTTLSFRLGVMIFVTLLTCLVPGLWILAVQNLVDAYGQWYMAGGSFQESAGLFTDPLLFLAALFLARKLDQMFKTPVEMSLRENVGNHLKVQLMRKSSRLPFALRESAQCQNQMEICRSFIEDIAQKANMVLLIFRSGIMMVSVVGAVSLLNLWIILALCIGTLPSFLGLIYSMKNVIKTDRALGVHSRVQCYYAGLMTQIGYAKELKAYGLYPVLTDRWGRESDYINRVRMSVAKQNAVRGIWGSLFLTAGLTGSAVILMGLIMGGSISAGSYVALFSAVASFSGALNDFMVSVSDVITLFERVKVFREFMELCEKPGIQEGEEELLCAFRTGEICYRLTGVSFRYPGCTDRALQNVNFEIRKGEHVAVVGENGAGKSTLVKLMLNLYSPESGEILFGGSPVQAYGEHMAQICDYQPQDFIRYQASLRENVLLHRQNALISDREIITALEQVGLSSFLKEIDYNLDTPLGKLFEDGRDLSGGQWQRIAIARVLLQNSECIFMDEPTSALDPLSEIEVLKTFLEAVVGRTAIIVSHRIGVARRCDKILVMEQHRLVEFGTHEELMEHAGVYRKMVEHQASLYR